MKTLIEGYRIFPGEHCGSSAMRGLLHHYHGVSLPEPAVFGLGAGLDSTFLTMPGGSPDTVLFGRTGSMEVDLAAHLGIDYEEAPESDDERAWQAVREEVLDGRPTMLTGDILYLDYREFKVHFPAHRFVLLGFDDDRQKALIADRLREVVEECSYAALATSRNPPEGISTHNLWGRFGEMSSPPAIDLVAASRRAIALCAERMLGARGEVAEGFQGGMGAREVVTGVAGTRRLAESIPEWRHRPDADELASFNSSCIERFGNGGGNFRRLYAGFLSWARERDPERVPAAAPELGVAAADGWTRLSELLWAAREDDEAWSAAAKQASTIADVEERLFELLRGRGA